MQRSDRLDGGEGRSRPAGGGSCGFVFPSRSLQGLPRFEKQMLTLRNSMRQWRHYSENDADSAG